MNKTAILQTAVCKLEDEVYVYESPLLPDCIGAAETRRDAWAHFTHHVETAYAAYLEGRLAGMYERPGRPAKHRAPLTLRVQPETKARIARLAEDKKCSQGEIADYLLAFWEAENAAAPNRDTQATSRKQDAKQKGRTRRKRGARRAS